MPSSRVSSQSRDQTCVSYISAFKLWKINDISLTYPTKTKTIEHIASLTLPEELMNYLELNSVSFQ